MLMPGIFGEKNWKSICRDSRKREVRAELKDGYLTVSAVKDLDEDEKDKETGKVHPP